MPSTYTVTIDQSAITAPNFPRSEDWWRGYLPIWFTHRQWWKQDYATLTNDNVRVDESTGFVSIHAQDSHHAGQIFLYFSVLRRHINDPSSAIRLVVEPTSEGASAK